jgi:L-fuconolactonase
MQDSAMSAGWIDTHAHFWDGNLVRLGWNPPAPLDRTYAPETWAAETAGTPIAGCIFVETGGSAAELAQLEAWTASSPSVLGFVAPMADDGSDAAAILARWAGNPAFLGVRAHHQDGDGETLRAPSLAAGLRLVAEAGRVFEFLVVAEQLPLVRDRCVDVPDLRVVIEHMGKPRVDGPVDPAWRTAMAALAADTRAVVKVSLSPRPDEFGDLVRRHPAGFPLDGVRRHVDALLDVFGPDRLVWGSDWPVSRLTASTADWLAAWTGIL